MTYTVRGLNDDSRALNCEVTTTAKSGKYRVITDYLTDPDQNTLVMHIRFQALVGKRPNYHLYIRYDPTSMAMAAVGVGTEAAITAQLISFTGHNVRIAYDTRTVSKAFNRTYPVPVYSALDASRAFLQVHNPAAGDTSQRHLSPSAITRLVQARHGAGSLSCKGLDSVTSALPRIGIGGEIR